ncbi:MAG TPA: PRC-barrel domain-containing protein, partial [Nitrospira sp.]|nr:PRC-barrel domain-containing protein [Nitrospira sp.]
TLPFREIHIPMLGCGIILFALFLFVRAGTQAQAEDHAGGMSNPSEAIGKLVKTMDGKSLGKIKDLVINWRSDGYTGYAVVSFGGFWGLGDEYVAVPWNALAPSDNKEYFVLNEEHLKETSDFMAYRFYDRSSVPILRAGRSPDAPFAPAMKSDGGTDGSQWNASVARSFGMQYAMGAEFHR